MENSFYNKEELFALGFKSIGSNAFISRYCRFYDVGNIEIGSNVRIDDFCLLSGKIKLGNYIHLSAYSALYGKFGIEMDDYSGLSPRCTIFSATDDFSGEYLIGPMVDPNLTNVTGGKVHIKKYSQLGSNCIVLPNLIIEEGTAVGAMSLVLKDTNAWSIYAGIPAVFIKHRSKNLLNLHFNE